VKVPHSFEISINAQPGDKATQTTGRETSTTPMRILKDALPLGRKESSLCGKTHGLITKNIVHKRGHAVAQFG
jgi:hypothetical protein